MVPTVEKKLTTDPVHLGDTAGSYDMGNPKTGDIPIEGEKSKPMGTLLPVFE